MMPIEMKLKRAYRGDFSSSMLLYKRVASTIDAPQSPVPTRPANHQLVNVHLWIVSAISANDAMGPWWDSVAPCYRLWHRERILRSKFRPEPLIYSTQYIDQDFIVSYHPSNYQLRKGMRWSVTSNSINPTSRTLRSKLSTSCWV